MAIEGAMQIEGGNWQIFEGMLNASDAKVKLNTTVTGIKKSKGKYLIKTFYQDAVSGGNFSNETSFDTVVLAAPLQYSNIKLEKNLLKYTPDEIPYVTLHVTLFTSSKKLNPVYFNLASDAEAPTTILTTLPPDEVPSSPKEGVGSVGFFSISTLRTLVNPKTVEKEYLYKIFSPEKVTPEFLSNILGIPGLAPSSAFILFQAKFSISSRRPQLHHAG
jgi:prenylcysteine oxidase/farnesylcysteine lyase